MRERRRRQLLHLATDLAVLAGDPDDLEHGFDPLTRSSTTPAAEAARAALRADPAIAPLIAERYWGPWPGSREIVARSPFHDAVRRAGWGTVPPEP